MCTSKKSFANLGLATISTANPNIDGTGSVATVLTGATTGTTVNQIIIKAQGNTSEGMVRLYIDDGVNILLLREVYVPASVQSAVEKSFEVVIPVSLILNSGDSIKASTENANTFNVIANGDTWVQCDCSDDGGCCREPQKNVRTGTSSVSTPNSNLDGSGSITTIYTSQVGAYYGGTIINTVNIKATGNTSEGMVRLFVNDGVNYTLVTEVPVAASTQTSIQPAYRSLSSLGIYIEPGYSLCASTQAGDTFNIRTDGTEIYNCECAK